MRLYSTLSVPAETPSLSSLPIPTCTHTSIRVGLCTTLRLEDDYLDAPDTVVELQSHLNELELLGPWQLEASHITDPRGHT